MLKRAVLTLLLILALLLNVLGQDRQTKAVPGAVTTKPLADLEPVLNYHEWGSAYEIKIGRIGKAYVGLYACAAILISAEALDLLTVEELQAVVAHKLKKFNLWLGDHSRAYAYPSLDERLSFNHAMTDLVNARGAAAALARK